MNSREGIYFNPSQDEGRFLQCKKGAVMQKYNAIYVLWTMSSTWSLFSKPSTPHKSCKKPTLLHTRSALNLVCFVFHFATQLLDLRDWMTI